MAQIIKHLPEFIDATDDDFIPVEVSSFEQILALEWVAKWPAMQDPDFSFVRWLCFASDNYGLLVAEMEDVKLGLSHHLIGSITDKSLIAHLPTYKHELGRYI